MTADLAWQKAILVWGVSLTSEERAAGWPDAFTPEKLVRLQYPWEGDAVAKRHARRCQEALWATIKNEMAAGTLPTVALTRTVPTLVPKTVPDYQAMREQFKNGWGDGLVEKTYYEEDGTHEETTHRIERAVFRDFLERQGEAPSEHIAAWFRPLAPRIESQEEQAPQMPKRETQADRLEYWLKECERLAAEKNEEFDRHCMPGKRADFVVLLRRLDPAFTERADATLQDYIDEADCKWPQPPPRDADAKPLYCILFDIPSLQVGVITKQRKKS